ncbi:hypothetical protein SmJEL517_g02263 [Synchytrium microbalum]|uniref:Aminopeptidase n=1 Tax=Synchytrium microbalum TaxID=1806994 RepID=A0A507CCS7_9FUNG|nr:uncharacterized protein SmJEL517_g02263 [Synchytrium microbalum]TPX35343.1 hypothetical protein SmJEL517_g02263 [Synchytrium microbalum]
MSGSRQFGNSAADQSVAVPIQAPTTLFSSFKKRREGSTSTPTNVAAAAPPPSSTIEPTENDPLLPSQNNDEEANARKAQRSSCSKFAIIITILILLLGAAAGVYYALYVRSRGSPDMPPVPSPDPELPLENRLPSWLVPYQYDLDLHVNVAKKVYSGTVAIQATILKDTSEVFFHSVDLAITTAPRVISHASVFEALSVEHNSDNNINSLQLGSTLKPANYTILIEYTGKVLDTYNGFFVKEYMDASNRTHVIAATHFETVGARYTFPCMDEPALKARFNISITTDARYTVLSNANKLHSEKASGDLMKHVFATTPPISTYLAAWVVGEFDRVQAETNATNPVLITVYSEIGRAYEGAYALRVALDSLQYFEITLKMPYPLPKLDLVSVPGFPYEGMENLGCMVFDSELLMVNGKYLGTAEAELHKQTTALLVAHEIAHQYFGDISTMQWWDMIFLAEGFAEYYQFKGAGTDDSLSAMSQFFEYEHLTALKADATKFSHPLVSNTPTTIPVYSFDDITYDKGASMLYMLESWLDEDDKKACCGVFCRGIQTYLSGPTVKSVGDLWTSLESARRSNAGSASVADIMDSWTSQPNVPLLAVSTTSNSILLVSQTPLVPDLDEEPASKWTVPIEYSYLDSKARTNHKAILLPDSTLDLKADVKGLVLLNTNRTGLYRVNYTPEMWQTLAKHLSDTPHIFSASERAGLVSDALYLLNTRRLDATAALDTTLFLQNSLDSGVWDSAMQGLWDLDASLGVHPSTILLKGYIQGLVAGPTKELKWFERTNSTPKEVHQRALTRGIVFKLAACVGEPQVLNDALGYFYTLANSSLSKVLDLPPYNDGVILDAIYTAVVRYGGPKVFELLWKNYTTPVTVNPAILPGDLLSSMAWTPDETNKVRVVSLLPHKPLSTQIRVLRVLNHASILGHALVWEYIKSELALFSVNSKSIISLAEQVVSRFSPGLVNEAIRLVEQQSGRAWNDFVWDSPKETALLYGIRRGIEKSLVAAKFRDEKRADVLNWLAKHTLIT